MESQLEKTIAKWSNKVDFTCLPNNSPASKKAVQMQAPVQTYLQHTRRIVATGDSKDAFPFHDARSFAPVLMSLPISAAHLDTLQTSFFAPQTRVTQFMRQAVIYYPRGHKASKSKQLLEYVGCHRPTC